MRLIVSPEQSGKRLDRLVVGACPDLSRAQCQRLIEQGAISLNGAVAKAGNKVRSGDIVLVAIPPVHPTELASTPMALQIAYEDEDVVVVDKPAGLVVHPAPGHAADTLVNALLARYPDSTVGGGLRPGIVHRLDKDTSGLMMVARNDRAMASLTKQMKEQQVLKEYLALVEGQLPARQGVIEAPIGRHPQARQRMAVLPGGREARTHFEVVETLASHTLVRARLETGRTHQIRVHFASLGHPVEGDATYGRRHGHCPDLARQFLHAARLGFHLPGNGEYLELSSELPGDLMACLAYLRRSEVA